MLRFPLFSVAKLSDGSGPHRAHARPMIQTWDLPGPVGLSMTRIDSRLDDGLSPTANSCINSCAVNYTVCFVIERKWRTFFTLTAWTQVLVDPGLTTP